MWKAWPDHPLESVRNLEKKQAIKAWDHEVSVLMADFHLLVTSLCKRAVKDRVLEHDVPEPILRRLREVAFELYKLPKGAKTFQLRSKMSESLPIPTARERSQPQQPHLPQGYKDLRYCPTPMPSMNLLLQGFKPMKPTAVSAASFPEEIIRPVLFTVGSSDNSTEKDEMVRITMSFL